MLYFNTVDDFLREVLEELMVEPLFNPFRLVGGTALSLQLGHRVSIDIDLFTDAPYGSIDFGSIHQYFKKRFNYCDAVALELDSIGNTFFVGNGIAKSLKVDLYYTDPFIENELQYGTLRLASIEEIAAMKIDVIQRGGRKKDFWDIHALMDKLTLKAMIELHEKRYPFDHDFEKICLKLRDFESAEFDFTPICLLGKHWEFIKEDIELYCGAL